jgi:O-antigen/teichoic acid export membrane protein
MLPVWTFFLTPEQFGVYEIARLLTVLLTCIGALGLGAAAIKYAVDLPDGQFRKLYGTLFSFQLIWLAFIFGAMELGGPHLLSLLSGRVTYAPYGRIATATAVLMSMTVMPLGVVVLRERVWTHVSLTALLAFTAAGTSAYLVIGAGNGAQGLLLGDLAGAAALAVACLVISRKNVSFSMDRDMLAEGLFFAFPLVSNYLAHQVLAVSDRFVIDVFHGSGAVGIYSIAYRFASVLVMVNLAMNRSLTPIVNRSCRDLARGAGVRDEKRVRRGLGDSMMFFATVVVVLGIIAIALSPELVRYIMASQYAASASLTSWVILGAVMQGFSLVTVHVLLYHRRTGLLAGITVATALLNILLNLIFVPAHGPLAAAVTTLACYAILAVAVIATSLRYVRPLVRTGDILAPGVLLLASVPALSLLDGLEALPRLAAKTVVLSICVIFSYWRFRSWYARGQPASTGGDDD